MSTNNRGARAPVGIFARSVLVTALVAFSGAVATADPAYIYGIHDPGGEHLMGSNKGWIVWTEAIGTSGSGGNDYSAWSNQGYGVIVRLNNGYGSSGTIPYESQYGAFASRCANYIQYSSGVDYWIIGNECNLPREWPGNVNGDPNTGEPITSARYINCYNQCYNAIKAVAPGANVCPAPSGTWGPPWPAQGIEGFVDYWVNCLNGIGASKIDGLILHTYTHGCDPALVTSEQKMGPPYEDIYYHFRAYKNYMWNIPASVTDKPVLITESDQNVECADGAYPRHAWYNVNNGWMRAAYAEINQWNQNNPQQIRCLVMFRWPMAQEGEYTFGLQDRDQCQADFQQAVAYGYTWSGGGGSPPPCDTGPGTPSGSNLSLTAAYFIESGRNNLDQYGDAALDGSTSTKWTANVNDSGGQGSLVVDLGSTASVTGYVLRHAESGGEPDYMNTQAFRVESGSSMFGPWTTEWSQDNSCQAAFNTFQYGSAQSLRYIRLVITDPGADSWIRLPEFEIYGTSGASATITVEAEDYQGGVNAANGTDYYDTGGGNAGGAYRSQDVDIETCTDGRYNVGWIANGEWLTYPIQGDGGDYTLYMRYATPYSNRTCHFEINGQPVTGTLTMSSTGGWQNWATLDCGTVNPGTGWKTISFHCDSDSFNIARFWLDVGGGGGTPTMNGNPPTGTNVATSSSQVDTDSVYASGWEGTEAIDGVIGSGDKWVSDGTSPPHWIKLDLGSTQTVNGYKIHHAEAGGEGSHYNTQLFDVQVGDSYNGPWTTHASIDNSDQSDAVTNLSYDTPQQVRYVRMYITDPGIDNYVRLPELEVNVGGGGGGGTTVEEDFNSMPSWSSSYDASWGSAASWSIASGGQSGNALQASRSSAGSSAKVKVYAIDANTDYTISIYIRCPSYGGSYWAECAYRLGNHSAQDFDENGGSWTMIKKFSDSGANGNGDTWTQYSLNFNSGSNTQISVGHKLGSSGGGGPTIQWDTLRVN